MRVLFLDIDGVLNRQGTKEKVEVLGEKFTGVDLELLGRLKVWLWANQDVAVVLSSSWRNHDTLYEHLIEGGLEFIGKTGTASKRGQEIRQWLDAHPHVTHFAILDDISTGMRPVGAHLVQTSEKWGLRAKDLKKLDKIMSVRVAPAAKEMTDEMEQTGPILSGS